MSQKAETAANTCVTNAARQLRRKKCDSCVGAVTVAGTGIRQFVPSNSPLARIRALRFAPIATTPSQVRIPVAEPKAAFEESWVEDPKWRRKIQPVRDIGDSMIASIGQSRIPDPGCVRLTTLGARSATAHR